RCQPRMRPPCPVVWHCRGCSCGTARVGGGDGLGLAGQGVNAKGMVVRSFFKWCDASMLGAYYYYAGGAVDRISAPSRAITFFKEGRSRIDGTRSLTPTPAVAPVGPRLTERLCAVLLGRDRMYTVGTTTQLSL